jgi:dimethylhistidine N-methyltransferase
MLDKVDHKTRQLDAFGTDVAEGLSRARKTLPSRWLYDDRGSELFEAITVLEEYYPTRTETAILREHADEIAGFVGGSAVLLEYGAGAGIKTEILIEALDAPRLYVPIDIAGDFLELTAERIRQRFPHVEVWPVVGDFTSDFEIPDGVQRAKRAAFFPGSTIGNLDGAETAAFLRRVRRHVGAKGTAIIGLDLRKDINTLLAAYDDREGVTAEFNLNLLARINRELGGDFQLYQFRHEARWNEAASAVEMHLVSTVAQKAEVDGRVYTFAEGETIHTESSRKYDTDIFGEIARRNGWTPGPIWTDAERRFAVFGLAATQGETR